MELGPDPADDADAFAKIDLCVTRRMDERHEHLAHPHTRQPHVILYNRVAARKAVLDPQPLENPLGRVSLLWWCRLICPKNRVDDRKERPELRLFRVFASNIPGGHRIAAHLCNRLPAQSKNPRRLPPALPLNKNKSSNRCVGLHRKHPRPPSESKFGKAQP
jgi:hypothetical protein